MKVGALLLFFFFVYGGICTAQQVNSFGLMPAVNLNAKLPKDWSVNLKFESRHFLYQEELQYSYQLSDMTLIVAKKLGLRTGVALGYLFRVREGELVRRSIQQMNHVRRYHNFKLAHRFVADQTFAREQSVEYRLRYRLSAEIPLSGHELDPKEYFLKINHEYLNAFQKELYDLEIRLAGYIGYRLTPKNKLEIGLDYRLDSFVNSGPRDRYWLGINFYQSILQN